MACATLKRSLDWEPVLGGRPAKRRRCIPFCASPNHHKDRQSPSQSNSSSTTVTPSKSVFPDVVSNKLTPEHMAANIRAEFKRLQRRKQLQFSCGSDNSDGSSSGGEATDSPRSEKPLFTFKQVGLICERMLREKESEIREEYDNVLTAKLAEQYDAFVKFTYDQIQKNYAAIPSCSNMTPKLHFLFSHLDIFPTNLGSESDEQGERFHQEMEEIERRYKGWWDEQMMADYCWFLIREDPSEKERKSSSRSSF